MHYAHNNNTGQPATIPNAQPHQLADSPLLVINMDSVRVKQYVGFMEL